MPRAYGEHGDDVGHQDPKEAISRQIADSVDLIVQVKRLRDGSRRTTNITEVIGMEGDVIVTQELFKFEYLDETADGQDHRRISLDGPAPYTLEKAKQFGFDQPYLGSLPLAPACRPPATAVSLRPLMADEAHLLGFGVTYDMVAARLHAAQFADAHLATAPTTRSRSTARQ
jgi:hypothetical protein